MIKTSQPQINTFGRTSSVEWGLQSRNQKSCMTGPSPRPQCREEKRYMTPAISGPSECGGIKNEKKIKVRKLSKSLTKFVFAKFPNLVKKTVQKNSFSKFYSTPY